MFPRVRTTLGALCRRARWEQDLEEELRGHAERRAEDLMRGGLSRADAERRARLELGATVSYKEQCREAHGLRWADEFRQDLRYAGRSLLRSPGFTAITAMSLALGIGVSAAVFGLIDAVFWKPLPVERPQELVSIYTVSRAGGAPAFTSCSYADFRDLRSGAASLANSAAFGRVPARLRFRQDAERVWGELVTGSYFDVVGVRPSVGRLLGLADDQPDAVPAVVISDSLWQRRFGRDPNVVGKPIRFERAVFSIAGVAPKGFRGTVLDWGEPPDFWVPLAHHQLAVPAFRGIDMLSRREVRWLLVIARIRPELTLGQAQAAAGVMAQRLARDYPRTNAVQSFRVLPANEGRFWPGRRRQSGQFAALLSAVALAVLLISCLNAASMLAARTAAQSGEIGLRLAIGAGAWRIARERLADSVALAALGCAASIPVAMLLTGVLRRFPLPFVVPIAVDLGVSSRVVFFTAALSLLLALAVAVAPALSASRLDIAGTLKGAGSARRRSAVSPSLRQILIVAQVAVSFVLVIAAGLLARSLSGLERIDPGYRAKDVLVASLELAEEASGSEAAGQIGRALLSRISALPGVESAGLASEVLPTRMRATRWVRLPDAADEHGAEPVAMDASAVSPGYFETVRMPLASGRYFEPRDAASAVPVVIVNQAAARRFWPAGEALGKRLRIRGEKADREVVGVVRDAKYHELFEAPTPYLFLPLAQTSAWGFNLHVRGSGDPRALADSVRRELARSEQVHLLGMERLESYIAGRLSQPRLAALLASSMAAISLVLSAFGLHGVLAYFVSRQRREIGIRLALGAAAANILKLITGRGLALVAAGLAIGAGLAVWTGQIVRSQLHGVSPADPDVYAGAIAVFLAVGVAASIGPAMRALGINLSSLLRTQ